MKKVTFGPIIWAAALATSYVFFLSPISGRLGGILFILTAWAIPTAINFLVTAWFVRLLPVRVTARMFVFVPLSFLFGVNVYLPKYFIDLVSPKKEYFSIWHSVRFSTDTLIDVRLIARPSVSTNPLDSSVEVSGDEGCVCLYFDPYFPDWTQQSFMLIRDITGRSLLTETLYELFPSDLTPGIHFDIAYEQDPGDLDKIDFILDVFEGTRRIATFKHDGIFFDHDIGQRTGREKGLGTRWFARNTLELLLHHNVWGMFAPQAALQFPEDSLRNFITSVLQQDEPSPTNHFNSSLHAPPTPTR